MSQDNYRKNANVSEHSNKPNTNKNGNRNNNNKYSQMRDVELVVVRSKEIAHRLTNDLGADESGSFHERVSSLAHVFSESETKTMRYIGSVRNSLVHKVDENNLRDRQGFISACTRIDKAITKAQQKSRQQTNTANDGGGCFIATAVYGDYSAPEVMVLRRLRDEVLAESKFGRAFIKVYYKVSPTLADQLRLLPKTSHAIRVVLNRLVLSCEKRLSKKITNNK
jgi:hypothetical protein